MTKREITKIAADTAREITVSLMNGADTTPCSCNGENAGDFYISIFKKISEELQNSPLCDEVTNRF